MSGSNLLRTGIVVTVLALFAVSVLAATPSNVELNQIILDQNQVIQDLKAELAKTKQELAAVRQKTTTGSDTFRGDSSKAKVGTAQAKAELAKSEQDHTAVRRQVTTGENADDNSWYIGAFGGANWMDGDDATLVIHAADVEFDTGYAVGGALGYRFENNFRAEVEFASRENNADTLEYEDFRGTKGSAGGEIRVSSIMVNAWYDFDITQKLKGHLGGGLGVASVDAKKLGTKYYGATLIDSDDTVFAYQAGAGLSYPAGKGVDLTLDYRLFGTREAQLGEYPGVAGNISLLNHSILAGIRVSFGGPN